MFHLKHHSEQFKSPFHHHSEPTSNSVDWLKLKAERIDESLKRQVLQPSAADNAFGSSLEHMNGGDGTAVPQDFLLPRPKMYSGIQTKDSKPLYFGVAWNEYDNQQWGFRIRENVYLDDIRFNT